MAEHFRALLVILVLTITLFIYLKTATTSVTKSTDFSSRRNAWISLTLIAFISHSFWIYSIIAIAIIFIAKARDKNPLALFFILLFAIPPAQSQIPGFGLINYLVELDHIRLLSLTILLPAFFALRQNSETEYFGKLWPDRFLLAYCFVVILVNLRDTTFTDTLRQTFYIAIDVFLPYFVASRGIKNITIMKDSLMAFLIATLLLAIIGAFEFSRGWLLYRGLINAMEFKWSYGGYLGRTGSVRASATTGQAIALGYVMAIGLGIFFYLHRSIENRFKRSMIAILLGIGLLAPLSRGPWVGFAAISLVFIITGKSAVRRLATIGLACIVALPLIAFIPGGEKILNLLPFTGSVESENITYREQLINNSLIVIERNPWFGSIDFLKTPEMQALRQGQGIVDIVNSYIGIALQYGLVGLSLFIFFFASILVGIRKSMKSIESKDADIYHLGRSLISTIIGILVIIFTVSSITVIPVVYWSIAGICVAYIQLTKSNSSKQSHAK